MLALRKIKKMSAGVATSLFMTSALLLNPGCASSSKTPAPNSTTILVQSTKDLNPDANNRASPLRVVVYELTSFASFESADFFSLSQKDEATLGSSLLKKHELFINPGESNQINRKLSPDAVFIGVFADYRDMENAVWRTRTAVPATEHPGMLSASLSIFRKPSKSAAYKITADRKSVHIRLE